MQKDLLAETKEFDGYVLRHSIGKGGMGQVFLATDTLLDRDVAIKFITPSKEDEKARQRFLVEARAIARLQHPNVVSIYRVGEHNNLLYLVSEYVRGRPLNMLDLPLSSPIVLKIALDLSSALAAAHNQGVLHRDIKPANAILSDTGTAKLLDFGIAKLLDPIDYQTFTNEFSDKNSEENAFYKNSAEFKKDIHDENALLDTLKASLKGKDNKKKSGPGPILESKTSLTETGAIPGTPQYFAPELWEGELANFASDVYSFGALIYTICANRPPHVASDYGTLAEMAVKEDAVLLKKRAPQISDEICKIIDKCVQRNPDNRYASGNELRAAFAQLSKIAKTKILPKGNPYRGLHSFESEHKDLYFGRDSEISMVLNALCVQPFVLIAGDSGVGKSSLCKAGVLPRVGQWLDTSRDWKTISIVPGKHPISSLSLPLSQLLNIDEKEMIKALSEDAAGVARKIRAWHGKEKGLVLFVDQFEEILTISDPNEALTFAEFLKWYVVPTQGTHLLATVRGDFLSKLASFPRIGDEITRALYFLRSLTKERLRDVIIEPAHANNIHFESEDLVNELIEASINAPGGLPLLQFTLAELWELRDKSKTTISSKDLEIAGGIAGSLARHADNVLQNMLPKEKEASKDILLRLVSDSKTRTRKTSLELGAIKGSRKKALDALVRGRLIVAKESSSGPVYDIAHESLVIGWPTLASWLSADADAQRLIERLRLACNEWERLGNKKEGLWTSKQIKECSVLNIHNLTKREKAFLAASKKAVSKQKALKISTALGLPIIAIGIYFGFWIHNQYSLSKKIDFEITKGINIVKKASLIKLKSKELYQSALMLFDKGKSKKAEKKWDYYKKTGSEVERLLTRASQQFETAIALDPNNKKAKELFADSLYEQALFAESRHNLKKTKELLTRLTLYDTDNLRQKKWAANSNITLTTSPENASVNVWIFELDKNGNYKKKFIAGPLNKPKLKLKKGSYFARVFAPGFLKATIPFVVDRESNQTFHIPLISKKKVPKGFIYIPPGVFLFGSSAEDGLRRDFFHTVPIHKVDLKGFFIAKYETTYEQWLSYLEQMSPRQRKNRLPQVGKGGFQGALKLNRINNNKWKITFQPTTQSYSAVSGENIKYMDRKKNIVQNWLRFPVTGISASDAEHYASYLARTLKVPGARLCTEKEWEKAARGADGREYPHGQRLFSFQANFDDTYEKKTKAMGPDEVGLYAESKSPYGLFDIAGNVWEWTKSSLKTGTYVARGGSYYFGANSSRTTGREITEPSFRDLSVGLRICADVMDQ